MDLLAPWQLGWLGLLVPLVVLYVLKRRRQERLVGSTLLWEAALRDMRAERPWKRLVPHVSLLLQALAIIVGAIALARPTGAATVPAGASIAVVVDASASMAAVDAQGVARIERARDAASDLAAGLPPGGRLMVVEASAEPVVLTPATDDRVELARVLSSIEVRGGRSDLEAAVGLAVERMRGAPPGSRVLVLTDAAIDGALALDATVPVEVRRVGEALDNTGLVAVDARPRPSAEVPDRADVFARVARFADTPVDVFVTAAVEGGGVLASRRITVPARGSESVVMPASLPPDADGRAPVVRVTISPASEPRARGMHDALALDDVAVAPSPGGRRLPVFLVGSATGSVTRVLRADEQVELFATTLAALAERDEDAPALDGLHVFVGEVPERPPSGDSLVLAPTGERAFEAELRDPVEGSRIVTWDEEDARMRFVGMADVHLGPLRPIATASARPLLTTDRGVAIATLSRPDGETTIVAFDPGLSDWPRHPSYVIFFRNLLERARQRRAAGGVAPGRLGEPLRVPAVDGAPVEVRTPSGATLSAVSRGGVAVVAVPAEPGVYRVAAGDRELFALRNLLDPGESDLSPRLELVRGGAAEAGAIEEPDQLFEAWPWFAAGLLLVLAIEAWWATRRRAAA